MYKNLLFTPIFVIMGITTFAKEEQKLSIDQATVFLQGAQLTSTAKVKLVKGENEILFTNVAGNINSQSLNVSAGSGVVVESAVFQNNYMGSEKMSPAAQIISDSIDIVSNQRSTKVNKIASITEQVSVLQSNRKVGGDNSGLSVTELTKLLDLINSRMEAYLNQKHQEEISLKKTDEYLAKLKKQLAEELKRGYQPGGQLLVKFYANSMVTNDIKITYTVPNAGWTPTYDIRVDDINKPANLFYKANVYQNSGVNWDKVQLTLSTGNPNEGVQAPELTPWYLSFYVPHVTITSYKKALVNSYSPEMAQAKDQIEPGMTDGVSNNANVAVNNSGISTTFEIDLPYTIPTGGKEHLVAVKKYDLPATYRYYAAPKLDKDAFLQAQITNWEDLNIISGNTNIFYEGTYVGQGYIDIRNTSDTLTFSLGRDKKIIVRREQDKKRRSVRSIGSNVKESFAYTITVRNTRKNAINIVIQDQLPVSNDKDIVIEDKEYGDGEFDENSGIVKWTLQMKPNDVGNASFGYTVKYPKGKTVDNMR